MEDLKRHGAFSLSADRLEITVDPGETGEDAFIVSSDDGTVMEGRVLADDPLFTVLTPEFAGVSEEIGFSYRSDGLRGGDKVKAVLAVITDRGEASVEVVLTVRTPYPVVEDESGREEIRNLFHFANLARRDFDEAVRLFYVPGLTELFHGSERKYFSIYRGLSGTDTASDDRGHNIEEFLIAIRKKDPMEYSVDRTDIVLDRISEDTEEIITVTRKGWGYTRLDISVDGDFLVLHKDRLLDRDFLGNISRLPVDIRHDALHAGKNFGAVRLHSPYAELEVRIEVTRAADVVRGPQADHMKKQELEMKLIRSYVDYKLGKKRSREWLIETGKTVADMTAMAPDDVRFKLYTAHYLITAARESEAVWVLDGVRTSVEETVSYGNTMRAYFLYLETLISRDERKIGSVEEIITGMLRADPENWRLAWLLQFLFDDRSSGNARRMKLYTEQFENGCRSPLLYVEALDLMAQDPSVLKKLDDLALFCLTFAARHDAIPRPLIDRVVWILAREKKGCDRMYRILDACYRADPESGAVDAMCALMIKMGRTDREAFRWYKLGVSRDSRITRLYEYYMMSLPEPDGDWNPEDIEIPRQVLMYFSYRSELPADKNALLYRYVMSVKEDEPNLYAEYLPQIERFVAEQMAKGRIDRNLSALYSHFSTIQPSDPVSAERFFEAIHTAVYEINDPSIRRVVVVYDRLRTERVFPVVEGKSRVTIYSGESAVLLEDSIGRRYARPTGQIKNRDMVWNKVGTPRRLVDEKSYDSITPFLREGSANINLYLTEAGRMSVTSENVDRYRRLAEADQLMARCRNEISVALIRFYYDNDFTRQLADYIPRSHPGRMRARTRGEILEMLVLSGAYETAAEWILKYGFTGVSDRTLYRLCSRAIDRDVFPAGADGVKLAIAAFRTGKYDESILSCVVKEYSGLLEDELAVYRACGSFSVDTLPLAERILEQLIFTGGHTDQEDRIFRTFVKDGGQADLEIRYIDRVAGGYLRENGAMSAFIAERIKVLALSGEELTAGIRLAYLKYHSDRTPGRKAAADEMEAADAFLAKLDENELSLPFLSVYSDRLPALSLGEGMRYITWSGESGIAVTAWVKRYGSDEEEQGSVTGGGTKDSWVPGRMREPYPGMYTLGEVLYPGESAVYFLTVNDGGTDRLVTSGILECGYDEADPQGETRYALTARLMRAKAVNDREAVRDTLYLIYKNEFLSGKLFPLPGE